jgi:uncharacterized protein YkwD
MSPSDRDATWKALTRTAAAVRAENWENPAGSPHASRRAWLRGIAIAGTFLAGAAVLTVHLATSSTPARADGAADGTLFALTNQDRASNGVGSLVYNGTLSAIGEGAGYNGCGFHVNGRSVDMIQRNYFSHVIAGCGQYVWSIMSAYGVRFMSAGENIGWVSGGGSGSGAANYINGQFMNSPDHRANILNGNYTDMGPGSAESTAGVNWTGAGSPGYQGVWMFSEEFAQMHSAPPPPPPPPPPPRPPGGGGTPNPPRNSTAPPAPGQPAAQTVTQGGGGPSANPSPTASATPTPLPNALLPAFAPPPSVYQSQGLIPGAIESVLEAFLIA